MQTLRQDLLFNARLQVKKSAFTLIIILTLVSSLNALVIAGHRQLENAPWSATAEEEKRGRELLTKVMTALGGSQKIDALTSYTDIHKATAKLPLGDREVGGRWVIEFARSREGSELPDRVREEVTAERGKLLTFRVYAPGNSFAINEGQFSPLTEERRVEWMTSLQQHPLMLLRARTQPGIQSSRQQARVRWMVAQFICCWSNHMGSA
jgi:hypothetical protein